MKIKLIDFGVPEHQRPYRPHGNDAGADVYLPYDCTLQPGEIAKIPLGFGLEIPDGYAGIYLSPYQHGGKKVWSVNCRLWIPAIVERSMRSSAM